MCKYKKLFFITWAEQTVSRLLGTDRIMCMVTAQHLTITNTCVHLRVHVHSKRDGQRKRQTERSG